MELTLGSNSFRNSNGVVKLQGKEQFVLELRAVDHQLLLTMDLYDSAGSHVAHLRRNSWAFNRDNRFALSASPPSLPLFTSPTWLKLTDSETGEIVFEARVVQDDQIQVPSGKFYTHKGQLFEITSHLCRLAGGVTMFGEAFDVGGGAVVIG
ncbi:MAG: hypothetical protein ACREIO_02245 [Nitrospiraceae bacterium]